ncbi:acetyltransferase [Nannocystis sp. ILAH1]|uniref:acetyltransferase n=1 Tax=unclassified Nannocystis TaxID=2627009 RepID=UPI00226EDA6C|nr:MULTISPECIES: acetyltransferase [unclassified Nannocystis]MCY0986209.1 acetyltransferase [Nannocystis sp. ILAH1]MCY1068804.1 acetyltransferase [Nannocystis sp. RBIL2]
MPTRRLALATSVVTALLGPVGCIDDIVVPAAEVPTEAAIGQPKRVVLRSLRLEVENFEQAVNLEQMRKLPRKVLDDLWLLDYDLTESVTVVLDELRALPPEEADALAPAAKNLRRLLNMNPDNVDLEGTKLEELIALSASVGVPPARALAALMQIGVTDDAIPPKVVSETFLDELLGSHPAAQTRKGAVDADHPDGLWPIAARSLPITLGDIVYAFESLPDRFGPASLDPDDPNALVHPGFVLAASGITEDAFTMYVRVNLNALPYKGVDLTTNYVASVNSTASQIHEVFDFSDPDWIRVEGLSKDLTISEMTVRVLEDDTFVPGGDAREPLPTGNSPAWDLPPWLFERLIAEMARRRTVEGIGPHCDEYKLGTDVVAFEACVDATGWTEMTTFTDVGNPPPPAYLWDLLSEVAQVRLHDGGLAEGDADVEFTLTDIVIPLDQAAIVKQIKANLERNPEALIGITEQLNDNADGDADFYYFKPAPAAGGEGGDYLFFVTEADLRKDGDGLPARPYEYERPGFFADPELTDKRSSKADIEGDTTHEKVRVAPGDVLYVEDDDRRRYRITVLDKPSANNLALELTRTR